MTAGLIGYETFGCEVELADGSQCGKPTQWQSVYTFHLTEKRFLWVCDDCRREIERCAREFPEAN